MAPPSMSRKNHRRSSRASIPNNAPDTNSDDATHYNSSSWSPPPMAASPVIRQGTTRTITNRTRSTSTSGITGSNTRNTRRNVLPVRQNHADETMGNDDEHQLRPFAELKEDAKTILFGSVGHIRDHAGTKHFSKRVAYYVRCYSEEDFNPQIGERIYKELTGKGYSFWMPSDHDNYRPATLPEIRERTMLLYNNGGGKLPRKRRVSGGSSEETGTEDNSVLPPFRAGESVYGFDQLYSAEVQEVEPTVDGSWEVSVRWKRFGNQISVLSPLQILKVNRWTTDLYESIDKAETPGLFDNLDGRDVEKNEEKNDSHSGHFSHVLLAGRDDENKHSKAPGSHPPKRRRRGGPSMAKSIRADDVTIKAATTVPNSPLVPQREELVAPMSSASLQTTFEDARQKCQAAVAAMTEHDEKKLSLEIWQNAMTADWAQGILEAVRDNIPSCDALEAEYRELAAQGLPKKMDAVVAKMKWDRMKAAQSELNSFVHRIVNGI